MTSVSVAMDKSYSKLVGECCQVLTLVVAAEDIFNLL